MRFLRHSRGSGWHVPFLSVGVATSPMNSHATRQHGRDDHALSSRSRALARFVHQNGGRLAEPTLPSIHDECYRTLVEQCP